jgi:hypothetical protein
LWFSLEALTVGTAPFDETKSFQMPEKQPVGHAAEVHPRSAFVLDKFGNSFPSEKFYGNPNIQLVFVNFFSFVVSPHGLGSG